MAANPTVLWVEDISQEESNDEMIQGAGSHCLQSTQLDNETLLDVQIMIKIK